MNNNIFDEYGIIIILFLIAIPVIVASIILVIKANNVLRRYINKNKQEKFNNYLHNLSEKEIKLLKKRQKEIEFELTNNELRGNLNSNDNKGLLSNINKSEEIRFVEQKKKSQPRPYIEPKLTKLILWYLACATFWLVIGTTIGEYLGIKFVAPDLDHNSWLSFGRLRPVHTNMVFWAGLL